MIELITNQVLFYDIDICLLSSSMMDISPLNLVVEIHHVWMFSRWLSNFGKVEAAVDELLVRHVVHLEIIDTWLYISFLICVGCLRLWLHNGWILIPWRLKLVVKVSLLKLRVHWYVEVIVKTVDIGYIIATVYVSIGEIGVLRETGCLSRGCMRTHA